MHRILEYMKALGSPKRAEICFRFFKAGKGEYAEGDRFLGLTVPQVRRIAKKEKGLDFSSLHQLLLSKYHEARLLALIVLTLQYEAGDEQTKGDIMDFYLDHVHRINNWDLVDLSAYKIVGEHLVDRDRSVLSTLARSGHLWSERIAMVSTFAFIRRGDTAETFRLATLFLRHSHDLMHKATGWMLREAGKRDLPTLRKFLTRHAQNMPRTMLRYSIEKMSQAERTKWMKG